MPCNLQLYTSKPKHKQKWAGLVRVDYYREWTIREVDFRENCMYVIAGQIPEHHQMLLEKGKVIAMGTSQIVYITILE